MSSHLQATPVGSHVPVGEHVHKLDQARHDSVQAISCENKLFCCVFLFCLNRFMWWVFNFSPVWAR